ncbi:MAG TPA: iron-containing alcohol dehydrogenase [Stellaceae bacterium]|nr:iron-containing alcohol dehydrogenase [Stellaceae bacterium]
MPHTGRIVFGEMEAVVFGKPAAEAVAEEARRLDAEHVFLMVSGTLNRQTDEVAKVCRALGNRFAGLFDRMQPHTPRRAVIEAAEAAREARADLIVTIGGGSVTDGAKAVQLCLANDIRTPEALDDYRPVKAPDGALGPPPCTPPSVRQITVPTTLSAGEFSAIAGVTDEGRRVKELFCHPQIIPRAVVLDPTVTVHTPEWLWLSTGIRAVDHCVEGICSGEANPFADAQALHGLALLCRGLPRVKADPADLEARLDCQIGSWLSMGPLAGGVPMGASHGIGYVLGAMFDVPHGHTSCIMLPAVMRWNKPANAERQALVAAAMGHAGEDAGDVLDAFIAGLGMPRSLGAVEIRPESFERIAEGAMDTPWVPRNPRPIPGPAQVREILELAA